MKTGTGNRCVLCIEVLENRSLPTVLALPVPLVILPAPPPPSMVVAIEQVAQCTPLPAPSFADQVAPSPFWKEVAPVPSEAFSLIYQNPWADASALNDPWEYWMAQNVSAVYNGRLGFKKVSSGRYSVQIPEETLVVIPIAHRRGWNPDSAVNVAITAMQDK